ncbi:MAG TPA: hypothetical protein VII06_34975 [Chloroflexota bacterium]|jgi:hypothetical protein
MRLLFRAVRFLTRVAVVSTLVSLAATVVARRLGLAPAVAAVVL